MSERLPLLRGFDADDPLLWRAEGAPSTAAAFCGAARALAHALPAARYAINRCEDPAAFMLGSAAALVAGCTLVLPPARAVEARRSLAVRFPGALTLVDADAGYAHAGARPAGARGAADARTDDARTDDARTDDARTDDAPTGAGTFAVPGCAAFGGERAWPPPAIDAAHVAAVLFTSGSTGEPAAQPKTWSALVRGARTFAASFAPLPSRGAVIGTVAAQHMFGLETTVMAPWQTGLPLVAARPLYPADLAALAHALADADRVAWLMTTPLHLRAFHAGLHEPPPLARIVVSTMPLPVDLAQGVERDWHVPVGEIYGCTEGGMLATRRTAHDTAFTPAPGLHFALADDGTATVSGGQLDAPLHVGDRFHGLDGGRLELIGRSADFVKIAGKRTTLAELSAALQSIPGVRDGAFVLPHPDAPRLGALAVAPGHDPLTLRRALARRIDAAFLPRPLAFAASLPRDAQGKLSAAALRDAWERALAAGRHARPDRTLERTFEVPASHPSLPGHFPGQPLVPGVVLLERVERLLRDHGVMVAAISEAKFMRAIEPGESLRVRVELVDGARARFGIEARGAAAASGTLAWKGPGA